MAVGWGMTTTVLRLHSAADFQRGVYAFTNGAEPSLRQAVVDGMDNKRHPLPSADSALFADYEKKTGRKLFVPPSGCIFGFKDVAQLRAWFYDDNLLCALSKYISLSEVTVRTSHLCVGNSQVMFDKGGVIRHRAHDLLEYLGIK